MIILKKFSNQKSINYNNKDGHLAGSRDKDTSKETLKKIEWIKQGAKERFEEMKSRDPEMYVGLLGVVDMYRKRDKEGLKMYLQKFKKNNFSVKMLILDRFPPKKKVPVVACCHPMHCAM